MWESFKAVDRILRGEATNREALRQGSVPVAPGGLLFVIALLGVIYGFCMGWYALFNREAADWRQLEWRPMFACMVKVPALFLLTLTVTFPSLYVFNALVGSRLSIAALLKLLVAALAVTLALLASFGPIVAFFSVSSDNYPFMVLLNVVIFGAAGTMGLMFLLQTLQRLSTLDTPPAEPLASPFVPLAEPAPPAPAETALPSIPAPDESAAPPERPEPIQPPRPERPPGALERAEGQLVGRQVKTVFYCWVIVFALVGVQMGWVLRPFIGDPDQEFTWFRKRESNFFGGIVNTLRDLVVPKR